MANIYYFLDKDGKVVEMNKMIVFSSMQSAKAHLQTQSKRDFTFGRIDVTFEKPKHNYSTATFILPSGSFSVDYDNAVKTYKRNHAWERDERFETRSYYVVTSERDIFRKVNGSLVIYNTMSDLFMSHLGVKLMCVNLYSHNLPAQTVVDWT